MFHVEQTPRIPRPDTFLRLFHVEHGGFAPSLKISSGIQFAPQKFAAFRLFEMRFKEVGSGDGVELRHIRVGSRTLEAALPTADVPRGTLLGTFHVEQCAGARKLKI